MAKDHEKNLARQLFIDTALSAKEIAAQVKITEKTFSKWREGGKWDELKSAKHVTLQEIIGKKYIIYKIVMFYMLFNVFISFSFILNHSP